MSSIKAPGEILSAIKSLNESDRQAVLAGIAEDEELREDLIDLAIIEERWDEPSRPFSEYEEERKNRGG
jgi:hypothetical protein